MNRTAAVDTIAAIQGIWPDRWSPARTEQWIDAVETCEERAAETTLIQLRSSHEKCPSIAEFLTIARPKSTFRRSSHSLSCMCAGVGWLEVEQHDDLGSWLAWSRCPNGPPTEFTEPPEEYDPVAGAAAYETFNALSATAETRADLANACFAAAAAYSNAERKHLL